MTVSSLKLQCESVTGSSFSHIQQLYFRKRPVPEHDEAKSELRTKLMKFDVSLRAFEQSLAQDEITGYVFKCVSVIFSGERCSEGVTLERRA